MHQYAERFAALSASAPEDQCEYFLKSFIFALGDSWKDVPKLCTEFQKHAKSTGPSSEYMGHIQAADFLQKHMLTRTALERRKEVEDIDYNHDGKVTLIEYLLMHYKVMILKEYYSRREEQPKEDLSQGGIGVVGVGDKLLEELFTMPHGLSPQLEAALEEFTAEKKKRELRLKDLEEKAAKGGVKGMAAKNELVILNGADQTELNRIEITLNAAKRKASKQSGAEAVAIAKQKEEQAKKQDLAKRRAAMKQRAALFEQQTKN